MQECYWGSTRCCHDYTERERETSHEACWRGYETLPGSSGSEGGEEDTDGDLEGVIGLTISSLPPSTIRYPSAILPAVMSRKPVAPFSRLKVVSPSYRPGASARSHHDQVRRVLGVAPRLQLLSALGKFVHVVCGHAVLL